MLRFAIAYGFRNIQAIVRQLKKGICKYDFIFPLQNINIKVVHKLENYRYQSVPINEATPSAICKKKCFSNKTCHICNIICCNFFCLHIMYNEIQFHAEEAQNSIMIVLFMPNLADLKSIKRNVLLEKVHTCK